MPQGNAIAPPPGFTDFCQRDSVACGAPRQVPSALSASNVDLLTTSSIGPSRVDSRDLPKDEETSEPEEAFALIQLETLTAYKPTIDASFVQAGQEPAAGDQAPRLAQAEVDASVPARPTLLPKAQMRLINTLNQQVNREVQKANDFELYGLIEFWSLPRVINGKMYGDCEDYALEKRRRLIAAGVPAEALSMAVAVTARGEAHAVLVVSFESGDWVLDNLTPWATPWSDLNYHWIERQVAGSSEWKTIG